MASLTVRPSEEIAAVRLYNDLPVSPIDGGFMVELGNLHAAEQRRLILEADVPAIGGVGLARSAISSCAGSTSRRCRASAPTSPST